MLSSTDLSFLTILFPIFMFNSEIKIVWTLPIYSIQFMIWSLKEFQGETMWREELSTFELFFIVG